MEFHADGQPLDASDEARRAALGRPDDFCALHPSGECPEEFLEFNPREMCPETDVLADPKTDVSIGLAVNLETLRFVEDLRVSVGGRVEQGHGFTLRDLLAMHFDIAVCRARELDQR